MTRIFPILHRGGKGSRANRNATADDQAQKTSTDASSSITPSLRSLVSSDTLTGPRPDPCFPDGVEVWHDCPDATVDICFVHGLTGDRDKTWLANGQSTPWPKALLPSKLPRARLLTYGYDAYIVQKSAASTNRLIDHATNLLTDLTNDRASCGAASRPLIFVVHSLGGLVCKEAILLSRNNPERHLRGLFDSVVGIVFMGTPHRGSWMADWARIPVSALGLVKSSSKSLLETIETDNQLLESVHVKFLSLLRELREGGRRLEVTCFFEELGLPVVGHVVSKASATFDGYTPLSVHANHRDMVRFSSPEDTGFKRVLGELIRWETLARSASARQDPTETVTQREGTPNATNTSRCDTAVPCHYMPFSKNKRFVGRDETLDRLKKILFVDKESQRVAVFGLGGVGKTQVALNFAYWVRENKPDYSTFWVPVLSRASFEQAYAEIARKLSIQKASEHEDLKESVQQYLSSEAAGPWLLVVDNADDVDTVFGSPEDPGGIDQYLPESENGLILFTTRTREVALSAARSDVVELQEMDPQEAMSLFEKLFTRTDAVEDDTAAAELLMELTHLPLAITQAAAYLNRNQVSISKYLGLLRGTEQDTVGLMGREFHDATRYRGSQNAVATTWLVSFDQIRRSDPAAAALLVFMSQIEPKAIPQSILPQLGSEEQVVHAIGTLCGYAFVARQDDEMLDMHSLVHVAMRIWVRREGLAVEAAEMAIHQLEAVFPTDDYTNRTLWRQYLPHAFRVLHGTEGVDIAEKFDLYYWVARCLGTDGRVKEAVKCFETDYRWAQDRLAQDDLRRLVSQHALAGAYRADGQVSKAIELLEQVVAIHDTTLAEDDFHRLASQHELARVYRTNGQIKKAIELLEHVVKIEAASLADDHIHRLASQHELASTYDADGQIKKAIELFEQVVEIQAVTLAEDHPNRLTTQHELASSYEADGQVKKAIEMFEQVLEIKDTTMAEDHPSRLASQHELARAYRDDGQVEKAIKLFEQIVKIKATIMAETHPSWLTSQNELAKAYLMDGQVKTAVQLLEQVVEIREITLAKDHPSRLSSQCALSMAYYTDGQDEKAVVLLEQAVGVYKMNFDEDNPDRLVAQRWLAQMVAD